MQRLRIHIHTNIHTHTHTHIHICIYVYRVHIYIYICLCLYILGAVESFGTRVNPQPAVAGGVGLRVNPVASGVGLTLPLTPATAAAKAAVNSQPPNAMQRLEAEAQRTAARLRSLQGEMVIYKGARDGYFEF